jgi:hypothetical protein
VCQIICTGIPEIGGFLIFTPSSVSHEEMNLYQRTMVKMVKEVLEGRKEGRFEIQLLKYDEFLSRLDRLR